MGRNSGSDAAGGCASKTAGGSRCAGRRTGYRKTPGMASPVSPDGSVWVRSPSRLYRKPPGATRLVREKPDLASSMFWGALTIVRDGSVMVASDQGLAIRGESGWSVVDQQHGLRTAMTSAALEDREGSLWIGLIGGGVARWLGRGEWESWTKAQGLPSDLIWSIRRDRRGALWVGTSLGLARLEGQARPRIWTRKDGLGGDNVRWLGETSDGAIWAVTETRRISSYRSGQRQDRSGRPEGRAAVRRLEPRLGRPAGPAVAGDHVRGLSQRPAGGFQPLHPHRAARIVAARGLVLCGRHAGEHVDHQSGWVMAIARRPSGAATANGTGCLATTLTSPPWRRTDPSGCATGSTREWNGWSFRAIGS